MAKKKAAKKKAAKKPANPKHRAPRIPRQEVLPGVGDTKIAAIENAALDYAEIRDERQELTTKEVDLKKRLLDLMHNKGLKEYKRNGISVKVQMEEETVKVRVKDQDELDAEPSEQVVDGEMPEVGEEAQPD